MKIKCKYCNKLFKAGTTGHKEFCCTPCYQNYRYQNLPNLRKKIIATVTRRSKERYNTDEKFREKAKNYSKDWQKRNAKRHLANVLKYQAKKKEMELMTKQAKGEDNA